MLTYAVPYVHAACLPNGGSYQCQVLPNTLSMSHVATQQSVIALEKLQHQHEPCWQPLLSQDTGELPLRWMVQHHILLDVL